MAKVDIDKFLCDFLKSIKSGTYFITDKTIKTLLAEQGLRFNGEEIVEIEPRKKDFVKPFPKDEEWPQEHKIISPCEECEGNGLPGTCASISSLGRCPLDYRKGSDSATEEEIAKMQGQIKPKFKVGDTIVYKGTENMYPTKMVISEIAGGDYWDDNGCIVPIGYQDQWELVESESSNFTKALAECIHQAQGSVVDPMAHAEKWESELRKLAVEQKPESNAVDILDGIDIERMEAEYCASLEVPNGTLDSMIQSKICSSYRKGLEDMLQAIRKKG